MLEVEGKGGKDWRQGGKKRVGKTARPRDVTVYFEKGREKGDGKEQGEEVRRLKRRRGKAEERMMEEGGVGEKRQKGVGDGDRRWGRARGW